MLTEKFKVRFYETDALKHVSNTVLAGWFEAAREPVFRMFTPDMDLDNWPLILAGYQIDFLRQSSFGHDVEVRTGIKRIGNSSFEVIQQVWQQGEKAAEGVTTMVHFDYHQQKSATLPEDVSKQLQMLMVSED